MKPEHPRQRLYLFTPILDGTSLDDTASFTREIEAALAAADIAAVLLRLAESDERTLINRAKAAAEIVQRRDVALLIEDKPELVARAGADGAHLTGIEAFAAALALLKPDRIAGAGGLRSRHDAMLAGEANADYVMFGDPDRQIERHGERHGERNGRRLPFEEVLERLEWWASLVELPCIGYAANLDEVGPLARTGADFVALGDWIWTHPQGVAAAIAAAAKNLGAPAGR
jgi:thiamine-phosphate pyrophosphorylase